ncbi:MAG TPA: hypothetical protein VGK48_11580 [Terriglobia bacterium]|jgi:hypothetical protein
MTKLICKRLRIILFALVLMGLSMATGYAQGSSYIFPGITTNNNITIGNLNPTATTVTINFFSTTGLLNSLSVDLGPGTQTRVNPASVSLTTFTGTVVITAPVQLAVSADQFEGSTAFDFMYPSALGSTLMIPFTGAEVASVDVNIFNPGPNQAEVKVALVQSNGVHTTTRTATLDPLHSTTIPLASGTSASYVFVTTANILRPISPVAASATIRSFNPSAAVTGAVPRSDIAIVPSVLPPTDTKTQVPFFTQGPDYFTLVQVENLSNTTNTILVTATQTDGTPFPGTSNPASIVVPPYGIVRQEMAQMFGSTNTTLSTGTITAVSQGTLFLGNPTEGHPAQITMAVAMGNLAEPSLAVILPQPAQTTFAFQIRGTDRSFFTGLSLANATANDAHVTMSFVLDSGDTLSTIPVTVPKGKGTITTLANLMPEAVGNGYLLMNSDQPITVVGLDGRSDNSALATRVPVFASPKFTPAPQASFLITGTVRDLSTGINGSNIGVPNVALSLSGPVTTTTATDLAGTYYFRDLPPGRYNLSALPVGFSATPAGTTIVITNANSRGNDFGIGLLPAGIQTVTPASAQVVSATTGSATPLPVAVQGTNFIEPSTFAGNIFVNNINKFTTGTAFVFDSSQVPTTVSSPTFLTASVPPSLLVTTGTVQVVVRNLGPSGDFVDSAPVPFIIGTTAPTLTNVTGVPSPLIAGQVANPFQVTVSGSGFTPATVVRVNFVNRPTTFVNQNQVIGTIFPSDLTIPGNVPITVQNPNTVDSAPPFNLSLFFPIPVISSITPNAITANLELTAQPVMVTVKGSNFSQAPNNPLLYAQVLVNGAPIQTNYVSTSQLTALIPANVAAVPGILQITVQNPAPSLAASNAAAISVNNPIAVISSVNGGGATFNTNSPPNDFFIQPVVVTGTNFSPNAVAWFSSPCDNLGLRQALSTQRNSAEQVIANIPIRCAGNYPISIANPQPGGGLSAPVTLNVPAVAASTITVIGTPPDGDNGTDNSNTGANDSLQNGIILEKVN